MGTRCVVGALHDVVWAPSHPKPRVRVVTKFPPLDHPRTALFGFRVFLPPVPPIKGAGSQKCGWVSARGAFVLLWLASPKYPTT